MFFKSAPVKSTPPPVSHHNCGNPHFDVYTWLYGCQCVVSILIAIVVTYRHRNNYVRDDQNSQLYWSRNTSCKVPWCNASTLGQIVRNGIFKVILFKIILICCAVIIYLILYYKKVETKGHTKEIASFLFSSIEYMWTIIGILFVYFYSGTGCKCPTKRQKCPICPKDKHFWFIALSGCALLVAAIVLIVKEYQPAVMPKMH